MEIKKSFILYNSFYESIKELTVTDKAQLLDAMFLYHISGALPELSPVSKVAFSFMKSQFDRDIVKYKNIVERNRLNGAKGGRPPNNPVEAKKATGLSGKPKNPRKADNDNEDAYDDISIMFEDFRKKYPGTKRGLETELENFLKKNDPEVVQQLLPALMKEIEWRIEAEQQQEFVAPWKNLSTWINQKCWEQEFPRINSKQNNKHKPVEGLQR